MKLAEVGRNLGLTITGDRGGVQAQRLQERELVLGGKAAHNGPGNVRDRRGLRHCMKRED